MTGRRDRGTGRVNPGRVAAARALVRVEEGAHAEVALDELLPEGRDRSLGWFLAFGVLRRRARIDAALRPLLRAPLTGLDPEVRAVLRLGAFERLFARTSTHAAVNEAVEVIRALGNRRATALVNAVLRRVAMPEALSRADALDHPAWLVERWDARYGPEATEAWCMAAAEPPPLVAVLRDPAGGGPGTFGETPPPWPGGAPDVPIEGGPPRADRQHGGASYGDLRSRNDRPEIPRSALGALEIRAVNVRGAPLAGTVRIEGHRGPVTDLPGFSAGDFWLQDAASVAVADLLGAGLEPGTRVLDACAAPGGKTFRLAARGARVTAVDVAPDRLLTVGQGAARLRIDVELVQHDWTTGACAQLPAFERVLVDAPCTGLGTLRRHPEIRWRRNERDLQRAAERQLAILTGAAAHLAPGGLLVYAVCSVEPEEGRDVVSAFLGSTDGLSLVEQWETAPPSEGEDAHYAALLRRDPGDGSGVRAGAAEELP